VTQQNAAMVDDAAAKAVAFQEEADRLNAIVERFKIAAEAEPSPRARPPTPAPSRPGFARLEKR
jgi:hypothetical protein